MPIKLVEADSKRNVQESHPQSKTPTNEQWPIPMAIAPALINLQRVYGNRFVQRVLSRAKMAGPDTETTTEVEEAIHRADGGQPLGSRVRTQMESALNADFSAVRVHTNAEADTLSRALNARAFTTRQDIFFRQGEYDPDSAVGRELLAHELTHVLQQKGGGVQGTLTISEPGDPCELEADHVARAVMQREQQFASGDEIASASANQRPGTSMDRKLKAHEAAHELLPLATSGSFLDTAWSEMNAPESKQGIPVTGVARSRSVATSRELPSVPEIIRPQFTSDVQVSRDDAGAGPAPRDAGPGPAAGPGPGPSPALGPGPGLGLGPGPGLTPGPVTLAVSIAEVNAPNTPPSVKRIPPRVDTNVVVTAAGWHIPMLPITLSIDGGSATNGTATINGAATHALTSTETVRLRGVTQTTPGNAGNLKLVAHQGATRLADSNTFSVAAFPTTIGFNFNRILVAETLSGIAGKVWGAAYDVTFVSDSGTPGDCNLTKISENVLVSSGTGVFSGVTPTQSNFLTTTSPQTDHHAVVAADAAGLKAIIDSDSSSVNVLHQFFRFSDERTGIAEDRAAGPKVPTSGFRINHRLTAPTCGGGGSYIVHAQKEGFANNGVAAGAVNDTAEKDAVV